MRVLLLSPSQRTVYGRLNPPYAPLGLLQLGSCLESRGHEVLFVDAALYPKRVEPVLTRARPDLVCITSVTPTFPGALSLARVARRESKATVVMGGPHVSFLPEEALEDGCVDFVVRGEGEETLDELVSSIEGGDPSGVKGISYKTESGIVHTERRGYLEGLDRLPFPDWSLVQHPGAYVPPEARTGRVFTIMTSRGCPYDCSFCVSSKLFGRKVRRRSVASVLKEIESLVRRERAKEIHFADDCFSSDRKWVLEFCDSVKSSGLKMSFSFMNGLRADEVDEELLSALKRIGVRTVGFGVESASQDLLDRSGKRLSLSSVREAFQISKKLGLNTWGFFIIGFREETLERALATFNLALELDPDFAKFFPLVPYPGSQTYESLVEGDRLRLTDWTRYGLYGRSVPSLCELGSEELRSLVSVFYRRFYLRPGKLVRRLLKVKSLNGLWLSLRMLPFILERSGGWVV
jgi:anaerobic magnesium-protoporphyrin IX monomethyl ester cyclase